VSHLCLLGMLGRPPAKSVDREVDQLRDDRRRVDAMDLHELGDGEGGLLEAVRFADAGVVEHDADGAERDVDALEQRLDMTDVGGPYVGARMFADILELGDEPGDRILLPHARSSVVARCAGVKRVANSELS